MANSGLTKFYVEADGAFHGISTPYEGRIVGYAAIIHSLGFSMPMISPISIVLDRKQEQIYPQCQFFSANYLDAIDVSEKEIEMLYRYLVFALKYEGVHLLFFRFLVKQYSEEQLTELVNIEPTGQYSRRIWFLIEWLLGYPLKGKEELTRKKYVKVVDPKLQYALESGSKSRRHLVINNLPGTINFCPMVHRSKQLDYYIQKYGRRDGSWTFDTISKDVLQRAAAFLLLKDSRATFTIEGENPRSNRAARWGQAIGQAGLNELTRRELLRLQQIVIADTRFVQMGFRKQGGFIGEHDRSTGTPFPDHISAKWQDVEQLLDGLLATNAVLQKDSIDPVIAATLIAFGFIFIHPFEDGNGRIHRYLIHHILARKGFTPQGITFPVSASILNKINEYREALEAYSHPLLNFIEWRATAKNNVEVLNDTIDYYRYFDATDQAEFLYTCVEDTLANIIPEEVNYLRNYDRFKQFINEILEMPDQMIALLVRFLEQGNGKLSKRAKQREFNALEPMEIEQIEEQYKEIFTG